MMASGAGRDRSKLHGYCPGEPELHDIPIIPAKIQPRWHKPLLDGPAQDLQSEGFQVMKKHDSRHGDVARRERGRSAVE